MQDKRQAGPRVATNIAITIQNAGAFVRSSIVNINSGGIFIIADNPLPIDAALSLQFHLPGNLERLDVQGRVVWIKQKSGVFPAGMGIQFTDITPAHQQMIQAFVEAHLRS